MASPSLQILHRLSAAALIAAGLCAAGPAPKPAAPAPRHPSAASVRPAGASLDTLAVRKLYMESDFEEAIAMLEADLKGTRPLTHADSVFIFKYLSVMYTSKYESRELGKRYMYRLLNVEPTARINDMFASDLIYMIFKNVQDEYFALHPQQGAPPPPPPKGDKEPKEHGGSKGHAAWYWTGGAIAVVAIGTVAYFLWSGQTEKNEHPVE